MELLDKEQAVRTEIFKYFGYVENWRVLPFQDCREYHWKIISDGQGGDVMYASTTEDFDSDNVSDVYNDEIYTQRFLNKWVYRGEEFTMILVDTHCDGNQFLSIFTNALEIA